MSHWYSINKPQKAFILGVALREAYFQKQKTVGFQSLEFGNLTAVGLQSWVNLLKDGIR